MTSLANYEPFYNVDLVILQANETEEFDGAKVNNEEVNELDKVLQDITNPKVAQAL